MPPDTGTNNPVPCNHPLPVFGCRHCIEQDRTNWEKSRFEAWKKTYKFPKCAACGKQTEVYGWDYNDGKLSAVVTCMRGNDACMDEDFYVEIP